MNISQSIADRQSLTQEQTIAAQQLHSLEFLMQPIMALDQKINEELASNPVLELDEPEGLRLDAPDNLPPDSEEEHYNENRDDWRDSMEKMIESGDNPFLPEEYGDRNGFEDRGDAEERRQYMMDSIRAAAPSMEESLREQLHCAECSDEVRAAAEVVIGHLDDSGYLQTADGDLAQAAGCSVETVQKALALVRSFDPAGIAARSVAESLLLQLERQGDRTELFDKLLLEHGEDLLRNRLPQIAKSLGISMAELNEMLADLKKLNPRPAAGFSGGTARFILPEADVVRRPDGEYDVIPNRDSLPRFHISDRYLNMLEDPHTPDEVKKYLREKILGGKQLQKNLDDRESTIIRIAKLLVSEQHDFLENGPESLHPLTRRQIADKLGCHETTVGRAAADKYLRTPRGLLPFSAFFSNGYETDSGANISSGGVKDMIRRFIAEENPSAPLSDQKLEAKLKENGCAVSRRTIAKYREELGIASSQERKVYT